VQIFFVISGDLEKTIRHAGSAEKQVLMLFSFLVK
jgi:hypothetical protein